MIIKVNRWYDGYHWTFYLEDHVMESLGDEMTFISLLKYCQAILRDGDVYKLRTTTPESLLDRHFEVS